MDSQKSKDLEDSESLYHQPPEEWLEMKTKLQDELHRLKVASSAANQASFGDVEELLNRITSLKEEFLEATIKNSINELIIKRIQLGNILSDEIFVKEGDNVNQHVQNSLKLLELAEELLRIHKETKDIQENIEITKLKNIKLYQENLEAMTQLKNTTERRQKLSSSVENNEDFRRTRKQIDMNYHSLEVCKNIIKLLILGLGIDWSADPEYLQLLLECGETSRA